MIKKRENQKDDFDIIIEPKKSNLNYFREIWTYRELLYFLAWRDIKVLYKQTVIGILWSVLRPLLTMVVFSIIFGKIAKLPDNGIPYPIIVFSALLPWQFFANSITSSSQSVVTNKDLVSKIYFPRIIIPISSFGVAFIELCISFIILICIMVSYKFYPSTKIIFIPVFLIIAVIFTSGLSLWFSALNVKYRDVIHVIPFIVRFGLYISPVGFNSSVVPEKWQLVYSLNPLVGIINGFRWAIIGQSIQLYIPGFILSIILTILIFVTGFYFFRKTEKTFADVI